MLDRVLRGGTGLDISSTYSGACSGDYIGAYLGTYLGIKGLLRLFGETPACCTRGSLVVDRKQEGVIQVGISG